MKSLLLAAIFIIAIILTTRFQQANPGIKPKLYPVKEMGKFHFGFSNLMGDLLWLRVIQNIDYCESDGSKAVNKGTNIDSILGAELVPSRCNKGWVFQMVDVITDLAPRFKRVYRVSSELLSVAVDDREGARLIFEKGLKEFPNYWELAYSASYHYLFEYQNPQRAAELLVQAADVGGPFWFRQMAGTLFTKAGQFVIAETTLKSYILNYYGERGVGQAKIRLKELYMNQGLSEKMAKAKLEKFLDEVNESLSQQEKQ